MNAISKIYQEIYFIVATSCWRNGELSLLFEVNCVSIVDLSGFDVSNLLSSVSPISHVSLLDMSRACISYAVRRSKPIPVEGGQVGTDTGRHFHRALQPLLGFIVGCPQDARSHNVVHQVISE